MTTSDRLLLLDDGRAVEVPSRSPGISIAPGGSTRPSGIVRAGELAPHDFTIRRGSMPIRGLDPMGADFAPLFQEWVEAGTPYYAPMTPPRRRRD